jgi:hypothetical protein
MFKSAVQFRTKKKQPSLISNGKEYNVAVVIDKKDISMINQLLQDYHLEPYDKIYLNNLLNVLNNRLARINNI